MLLKGNPLFLDLPILQGVTSVLALDTFFKLKNSYSGPCINVRRSSDNATQDIGFNGNVLDIQSLLSFVGSNNGFITAWYDQSGNSNNATQVVALNQPKIVSNGSILTLSNFAVGSYSAASSQYLTIANTTNLAITGAVTFYTIFNPGTGTSAIQGVLYKTGNANGPYGIVTTSINTSVQSGFYNTSSVVGTAIAGSISSGTPYLVEGYYDGSSTISAKKNNSSAITSSFTGSLLNEGLPIYIGQQKNGFNRYFDGKISTGLVFNSYLTNTQRSAIRSYLGNQRSISVT